MPVDEGVSDPGGGPVATAPDPSWGPPQRRSRLAGVAVLLCLCLVTAGIVLTDRIGSQMLASGAMAYVPDDGAVAYARVVTAAATPDAEPYSQVTESARYAGAEGVGALDFALGSRVLGALPDNDDAQLWRTTTTRIGERRTTHQQVRVYRLGDDVSLVAESGPGEGHVFQPALVELPADVEPGMEWVSSGSAGDHLDYRATFRAEAGEEECLVVRGAITYTDATGQQAGSTRDVEKTWCQGRGITAVSERRGDWQRTETPQTDAGDHSQVKTEASAWSWQDKGSWSVREYGLITIDPNYGTGMMTSASAGINPVITASGRQVRATSSASDLIAFTAETQTEWQALWRMHPGGTILTLAAFGDVLVTTTAQRSVVAYTDTGVRLWAYPMDDLVRTPPARLSETQIVVGAIDGRMVALDLRTGKPAWERHLRTDVAVAPAADADHVAVADRAGQVSVLGASDGAPVAEVEVSQPGIVTMIDSTLVVQGENYIDGFELATGERRWRVVYGSLVDRILVVDSLAIIVGQGGTVAVDPDGRVVWRHRSFSDMVTDGSTLVGLAAAEAEVLDLDGNVITTFTIPVSTATSTRRAVAVPRGLWLFGSRWEFREYGHGG